MKFIALYWLKTRVSVDAGGSTVAYDMVLNHEAASLSPAEVITFVDEKE